MSYMPLTRTAPGWEERTAVLLAEGLRAGDGAGDAVCLRPGFARLAVLLDVAAWGGGAGLRIWLQHSPDGERWLDVAAFPTVAQAGPQVAWIEAQPELSGTLAVPTDGTMSPGVLHSGFVMSRLRVRWGGGGASHSFGVEAVAIYPRVGSGGGE